MDEQKKNEAAEAMLGAMKTNPPYNADGEGLLKAAEERVDCANPLGQSQQHYGEASGLAGWQRPDPVNVVYGVTGYTAWHGKAYSDSQMDHAEQEIERLRAELRCERESPRYVVGLSEKQGAAIRQVALREAHEERDRFWRTASVTEVASMNASVRSYVEGLEKRADSAEMAGQALRLKQAAAMRRQSLDALDLKERLENLRSNNNLLREKEMMKAAEQQLPGPPFAMSKYSSEVELLRDKCAWQERELTLKDAECRSLRVDALRHQAMRWQFDTSSPGGGFPKISFLLPFAKPRLSPGDVTFSTPEAYEEAIDKALAEGSFPGSGS